MTEHKVSQLKSLFPDVEESSLLELLVSCNGSIASTRSLLIEAFPEYSKKHTPNHNRRQQNIRELFGASSGNAIPVSRNTSSNSNKPVLLYTKQSIESTLPYVTCHYNFLPQDLADSLLKYVLEDKEGYNPQEFYLFGNKCISKHINKLYTSDIEAGDYYYNGSKVKMKSPYGDEMKIAQLIIQDQVNKEIAQRPELPFQNQDRWKCDVALCNKYIDKSNDLDWHSDRLTYIGPHCVIASLTLGSTREFRVRKQYNDSDSKFNTIYSIPLPHNTLLIMHAGFQEEYKHSVSSTTQLDLHPISGPTRINFTYRNYLDVFREKLPMCPKCGYQMDLRRSYKIPETRGRYIWLCTRGYKEEECNGFYWANFKNLNQKDEPLYTSNLNDCSIWISRTDHQALNCFRNWIDERLADELNEKNEK